MSCFPSSARFLRAFARLVFGVLASGMFGWSAVGEESAAIPNFSPDSRVGWIAGDLKGPTPIGDDFLPQPPQACPGKSGIAEGHLVGGEFRFACTGVDRWWLVDFGDRASHEEALANEFGEA